jgi:aldehyde dehydrogenase (NAD+)
MKDTAENIIVEHFENHKAFFATQQTKDVGFRLQQLRKLKKAIQQYQERIENAL